MRFYRSRKTSVPLWLVKFEERPYTATRFSIKLDAICDRTQRRFGSFFSSSKHIQPKDPEKPPTTTKVGDVRMGSFVTASCVNCHLVLTSIYVVVLFSKTALGYGSRNASDPPPLIDGDFQQGIMTGAVFSTAYFGALGYIAILLPDVPPRLYNLAILGTYIVTMTVGTIWFTLNSILSNHVGSYRYVLYNHLYSLSSQDALSQGKPADATAFELAKIVYHKALQRRLALQLAHGIIAIGGVLLASTYLYILVTLTRRVSVELAQISSAPSHEHLVQTPAATKAKTVTAWPTAAVPFSMPVSPSQAGTMELLSCPLISARSSLTFRNGVRTPPPTPAPSCPLPLPPAGASHKHSPPSSRASIAFAGCDTQDDPSTRPNSPLRFRADAISVDECLEPKPFRADKVKTHSQQQGSLVSLETIKPEGQLESSSSSKMTDKFSALPRDSIYREEFDLGPRTRLGSEPTPWAMDAWRDDLASNEGYAAVCRFLFNCVIDHCCLMIQCLAFGINSVRLLPIIQLHFSSSIYL